jgi:Bacterial phospho-glucose isomerase C-terminal SIS domain
VVAAELDEIAAECGPARESFVNPAKTLALELIDALPVIAAEGPLAGAAAERVADQLATLAGLPVTGFRLPDQRVAARAVLAGPLAPEGGEDDFFRDRADDPGRRPRLLTIRDTDAVDDGAGEREPRSAAEAMHETLRTAAAGNVPVSGLAEHGDPDRYARLPRLARQLAVGDFSAVYLALALDAERSRRD